MLAGYLALMIAALFTGAAFYISFAEQPARLRLDDRALLAQWKPAYKRGFAMQAPLAVVGFVLGIVAWWLTARLTFLVRGVLLLANWPWTIFSLRPIDYPRRNRMARPRSGGRDGGGVDRIGESIPYRACAVRMRPSIARHEGHFDDVTARPIG